MDNLLLWQDTKEIALAAQTPPPPPTNDFEVIRPHTAGKKKADDKNLLLVYSKVINNTDEPITVDGRFEIPPLDNGNRIINKTDFSAKIESRGQKPFYIKLEVRNRQEIKVTVTATVTKENGESETFEKSQTITRIPWDDF